MRAWLAALGAWWRPVRPIPDPLWQATVEACALLSALAPDRRERLRGLAARFLARKRFAPAQGLALDDARCLLIAAQACLPVIELGFDYLEGWREVIVYPGEFRVRREHHDDATGVITEGDDDLIGEAWERGPLILSWVDIETDLAHPHDGLNVIVHEIAHKLDMRDGEPNGVPPLPPHVDRRAWIVAFQDAFDAHVRAVKRRRRTAIDAYAAEAPDEFFACVSEMHFSDPTALATAAPAVAQLLRAFYDGAATG